MTDSIQQRATVHDDARQPTPMARIAALLDVCDHDLDLTTEDPGRDIWDAVMNCGVWTIVTVNRVEPVRRRLWRLKFTSTGRLDIEGIACEDDADLTRNHATVSEAIAIWRRNQRPGVSLAQAVARKAFTN